MSLLPEIDWNVVTNLMLHTMQAAQRGLLHIIAALGLSHSADGQPAWPFAQRLSGEVMLIDRTVARALFTALVWSVLALLTAIIALTWRRGRIPLLAVALVIVWFTPWPDSHLLLSPATPASFHTSTTGFSAAAIVRGELIYTQQCISCHGADGRGNTPQGLALQVAPPNLASGLLWRKADGDVFWHIRHGKGGMPAFARLSEDDAWALIDYMKANAAGNSIKAIGSWSQPIALPAMPLDCASGRADATPQWRGQRVRLVLADKPGDTLPLEDPRLHSAVVGAAVPIKDSAGQPAIDCRVASGDAWESLAIITGVAAQQLDGTQLIADRDGWLRARKAPGTSGSGWSDEDMLCRSPLPASANATATGGAQQQGGEKNQQGLDKLIAIMDAEPVRFVKGGFVH